MSKRERQRERDGMRVIMKRFSIKHIHIMCTKLPLAPATRRRHRLPPRASANTLTFVRSSVQTLLLSTTILSCGDFVRRLRRGGHFVLWCRFFFVPYFVARNRFNHERREMLSLWTAKGLGESLLWQWIDNKSTSSLKNEMVWIKRVIVPYWVRCEIGFR